jgi:hypothetical protein
MRGTFELRNMTMRLEVVHSMCTMLLLFMFANHAIFPVQAIRNPFAQESLADAESRAAHMDMQSPVLRVELLHRDHPSSPLYTRASKAERIARSVRRSSEYLRRIGARHERMRRVLDMSDGEYVMHLNLGTPPQRVAAVMSTVESVVWVQCLPCDQGCYQQLGRKFNPQLSTTFRHISCTSLACPVCVAAHFPGSFTIA